MGSTAKNLRLISRQFTFLRTYSVKPTLLGSRSFRKLDQNLDANQIITSNQLQTRYYSTEIIKVKLSLIEVQRVFNVCSAYDKVTADKLLTVLTLQRLYLPLKRSFSAKPPLSMKLITDRVLLVLQLYDKVDPAKLTLSSHFMNDLGLDSLDHVEIIMAMEDEFAFEIPDSDADKLQRPLDIVKYVADKEDVFD